MGSFVSSRLSALPAVLNGPNAQAWARTLGSAQDDAQAVARVAGLVRSISKAPDDALDVIGRGLGRPRSPREVDYDDLYRARLVAQAWSFWENAPTLTGLAASLAPYLDLGDRFFLHNDFDAFFWGGTGWFSRVAGVIVGGVRFAPGAPWGTDGTTWGDGGLWGLWYDPAAPQPYSFGVADLDYLKWELRRAKGAGAYPTIIAIGTVLDAQGWTAIWGDGATWGDGGNWGNPDASTIVYLTIGHVWGEEQIIGGGPGLWGTTGDTWDSYDPPSAGW